jgi:branched-chain amino acid aminotransferase
VITWFGDRLVDEADVRISPADRGFTVGDGVFETLRTYGGRPFALRRHLERLAASADALGLVLPPRADLAAAIDAVILANGLPESRVRVTVTAGEGAAATARGDGPPTLLVTVGALPPTPPTGRVAVVPWTRNPHDPLAGVKATAYGGNVRALRWAQARGADEGLFATTGGHLCEGTGTNVFVVLDGALVTPPLAAGCLAGVTRGLLLESAAAHGLEVAEAQIELHALAAAPEAFLTSTTREVQPIAWVDGTALPSAPGPLTVAAAELFAQVVAAGIDP